MYRSAAFALIFLVSLISVFIKVQTVVPEDPASAKQDRALLKDRFSRAGFTLRRQYIFTRDETYVALQYQDPRCDGELLILPLYRNAEAAGLIDMQHVMTGSTRFIADGGVHASYPATMEVAIKLAGLWHGLMGDGSGSRKLTSNVYAFRESGSCDLAGTVIGILESKI